MPLKHYKGVTMKEMSYDVEPRARRPRSKLPWILLVLAILIILILIAVIVVTTMFAGGSAEKVSSEAGQKDGDGRGGVTITHSSTATKAAVLAPSSSTGNTVVPTPHSTSPSTTIAETTKPAPTHVSHPGPSFPATQEGQFIKIEGMKSIVPPGILLEEQGNKASLSACLDACTKHHACFGVDFDNSSNDCSFIPIQRYDLEEAEGFTNYRWLFTGATSCEVYFLHFADRKPLNGSEPFIQPPTVDSEEACMSASLGRYSDAEGPSGKSYIYVIFDKVEKRCYLYETWPGVEEGTNWELYRQDLRCHPPEQPDCMDTVFRFANNVPGPSFGIQYVQHPEVDTFMGCEEASYKFRTPIGPEGRSLKKAVGFMYNRKTGECSIAATANASLLGNTDYQAAPDKDFYVYSGFCGGCEDLFSNASESFVSDSEYPLHRAALTQCRESCLQGGYLYERTPTSCYGFDYIPSQGSCRLIFHKNYTLVPMAGAVNYKRTQICQDKCSQLPSYIPTVNTFPPRGIETRAEGASADSHTLLLRCAFSCQGHKYIYDRIRVDRQTCFGFSFNKDTGKCYLYYDFDYHIGDVGNDVGFTSYRRKYTCREKDYCSDTYTSSPGWHAVVNNSSSSPGLVQPWDINTLERCQDRCWGYEIATIHNCYGIDFNYTSNTCTIYTVSDYHLEPGPGNDHYRRDMACRPNM